MASLSVVIKVKHGETLRRFNAIVKGDQHLQLNMEGLRAKVGSLFNFPPDANFKLTYVDEDGDEVTLADNEDLHDVVIQGLNPVRLTVYLDSCDGAFSGTPLGENLTSSRSSAQNTHNINRVGTEGLKSLPEPVLDAVSKLSAELAFKVVSTNPFVKDLVDSVSKMVQALQNPLQSHFGTATTNNKAHADHGVHSTEPSSKSTQASKVVEMSKGTESMTSIVPPYLFFQRGKDVETRCSPNDLDPFKARLENSEDAIRYNRDSRCGGTLSPSTLSSPSVGVPSVHKRDDRHFGPRPFDGNFYNADSMGSIFHKGIRCDGCGVLPITGSRFKSKVKYNYDLCNICFTRMGNYADYTRIDFPSPNRHMFMGFLDAASPHLNPIQPLVPSHLNQLRPRLDSRFIKDVHVMDGTVMAPSTPFTKIWRMLNSGTQPWSQGLQLHWIGGDRFISSDSVNIEIPVSGVDVGKEVDVAVDFVAPELAGQYFSYWRMAEPSGHKFGQRVWVLIQVDASFKEDNSTSESSPTLYFHPPPENAVDLSPAKSENPTADRNQKIAIGDLNLPISDDSCIAFTSAPLSSVLPPFCTDNTAPPALSLVSQSVVDGDLQPPSTLSFGSNPKDSSVNISKVEDENSKPQQSEGKNAVEDYLLKELEEMGFKEINLNKEVLRGNEYDLEKSVDELCGISEWDPILKELKEMGFHDKVMNKKLLEKNNGSIMHVVMDLISDGEA